MWTTGSNAECSNTTAGPKSGARRVGVFCNAGLKAGGETFCLLYFQGACRSQLGKLLRQMLQGLRDLRRRQPFVTQPYTHGSNRISRVGVALFNRYLDDVGHRLIWTIFWNGLRSGHVHSLVHKQPRSTPSQSHPGDRMEALSECVQQRQSRSL